MNTNQSHNDPYELPEEKLPVQTEKVKNKPNSVDAAADVVTDPALNVREGADWSDEGGASPNGPATAEAD